MKDKIPFHKEADSHLTGLLTTKIKGYTQVAVRAKKSSGPMPGRTSWGHDLTTKQTRLSSQVLACLLEQNDQPQNNDHNVDIDHKMFTVQHSTMKRSWSCEKPLTPVCLLFLSWIAQRLTAKCKLMCSFWWASEEQHDLWIEVLLVST